MKSKIVATLAVAVVAFMVFATAGATTYSWFSDSEETDITITTAKVDIYTKWDGEIVNDSSSAGSQNVFSAIIENIAPGFGSDHTYMIFNESTTQTFMKTYVRITGSDELTELATQPFSVTFNGVEKNIAVNSEYVAVSDWVLWNVEDESKEYSVSIDMGDAGNEWAGRELVLYVKTDAYQSNGTPSDDPARTSVGNKGYSDLRSAIADAKNGDVITIYQDIETDGHIAMSKSITIEGNGNELGFNSISKNTAAFHFDTSYAEITLRNITLDTTYADTSGWKNGHIYMTNGKITLDGCVMKGTGLQTSIFTGDKTIIDCKNTEFIGDGVNSQKAFYLRGVQSTEPVAGSYMYRIEGCTFSGWECCIAMEPNGNGMFGNTSISNNTFYFGKSVTSNGSVADHTGGTTAIALYVEDRMVDDVLTHYLPHHALEITGNEFIVTEECSATVFSMSDYDKEDETTSINLPGELELVNEVYDIIYGAGSDNVVNGIGYTYYKGGWVQMAYDKKVDVPTGPA